MGNAGVSPSVSHKLGKWNKIHPVERAWEIGNHTFHRVWEAFFHQIPILCYTTSYVKWMGFPMNFSEYVKMQQNPSYGRDLAYGYPYLSQSMVNSLPSNLPSILYHMGNDWVFPSISHSMGKCSKIITTGETWDVDTHTSPKVWLILYH